MTETWNAILLGIVQGITEFLPVSSSAHLLVVGSQLSFSAARHPSFYLFVQLASTLAIILLYKKRLGELLRGFVTRGRERYFCLSLVCALVPAFVLGIFYHTHHLPSMQLMASMLILGGLAIIVCEWWVGRRPGYFTKASYDTLPLATSGVVGAAQCLAIIPGVSRSGSTILGAMLCGVNRSAAVEFSFFLSIPTSLISLGVRAWQVGFSNTFLPPAHEMGLVVVGFLVSFIVSVVASRLLIAYIKSHTLSIFGWWRIIFGVYILATLL